MASVIDTTQKIFLIILIVALILFIPKMIFIMIGLKKQKPFKKATKKHKYAIIIPARYESKVIRGVLDSIQNQTYDKNLIDTYVIVPDNTDESINIVKEYKNTYVHILDHKVSTKGATMDSLFKLIMNNSPDYYDAYIIVDADNILDKNFVEHMNDAFDAGYDVVLGGRQNKNWKDGWVSNCSALTFSFINGMNNKARTKFKSNILISGSGLLISKKIIQENNGWPWQTLTEDYEFSQITFIKDYKACYYELAKTFDEQPNSLKQSTTQLTRWVKGHNTVDSIYRKDMIKSMKNKSTKHKFFTLDFMLSLLPMIILVIDFALFAILNLNYFIVALIIKSALWKTCILNLVLSLFGGWTLFMLYSALGLLCDRDNIRMDLKNTTITLLMSPLFFSRYIPIYIKCLNKKEVKWERIDHSTKQENENGNPLN